MRSKVKLGKQAVFFVLSACLSIACTTNAPPPVPVSPSPMAANTESQAEQQNACADSFALLLQTQLAFAQKD